MAVVFNEPINDTGSAWYLKKLFGEETEEEARARAAEAMAAEARAAAEAMAAEARAAAEARTASARAASALAAVDRAVDRAVERAAEDLVLAAKAAGERLYSMKRLFEEAFCVMLAGFIYLILSVYAYVYGLPACTYQSETSKVLPEGGPCLYSCLCYPKEELKKEDEEWYEPHYERVLALLPKMFRVLAIERIYNNEPLPKMFNDWALTHGKRYDSVYEWRLRYKIWCSAKMVTEERCSRTGQTFSIDEMNRSADQTMIERVPLHGYIPSERPLSEVKRFILKSMGKVWMKEVGQGFEEWAERHKRVYSSTEEREDRCLAYMENMRRIKVQEKLYPGFWKHGYDLENMDKFSWEADLLPPAPCSRCWPRKLPSNKFASSLDHRLRKDHSCGCCVPKRRPTSRQG